MLCKCGVCLCSPNVLFSNTPVRLLWYAFCITFFQLISQIHTFLPRNHEILLEQILLNSCPTKCVHQEKAHTRTAQPQTLTLKQREILHTSPISLVVPTSRIGLIELLLHNTKAGLPLQATVYYVEIFDKSMHFTCIITRYYVKRY